MRKIFRTEYGLGFGLIAGLCHFLTNQNQNGLGPDSLFEDVFQIF